jgi:hypothetical protein
LEGELVGKCMGESGEGSRIKSGIGKIIEFED